MKKFNERESERERMTRRKRIDSYMEKNEHSRVNSIEEWNVILNILSNLILNIYKILRFVEYSDIFWLSSKDTDMKIY